MFKKNIIVPKTARYFVLGESGPAITNVWFVCHGYGQLASYFIRNFESLENKNTLIVAPEGLHRFYWEKFSGRVVASWMTKEDREEDITDYVNYLDMVYQEVMQSLGNENVRVTILGFSQGVATVSRWMEAKQVPVQQLIFWAGTLPPELNLISLKKFKSYFVVGDADEFIRKDQVEETEKRLSTHQIPYEIIRYQGKHEIDEPTLLVLSRRSEVAI